MCHSWENTDVLDWLRDNAEELLYQKDNKGRTIAHPEIHENNPVVVEWLHKYVPQLFHVP